MDQIFFQEDQITLLKNQKQPKINLNQQPPQINFVQKLQLNNIPKIHHQKYKSMLQQKNQFALNGNNKNKYINRIKVMVNQVENPQEVQTVNINLIQNLKASSEKQVSETDKTVQQKQKNRLSAKMSRQRKKVYMQLLQNKISELKKQNQKKIQQLNSTQVYLQKIMTQNQTMNNFTVGRQQIMKKIQKLIQSQNPDMKQIILTLDSLHYGRGFLGKQRINTIHGYFKQIVNISFPALHRYLMWTATQKKHLFSENNALNQTWFLELQQKLGLSQEQRRQIQSRRIALQNHSNSLKQIMSELQQTKQKIQLKSQKVQEQIQKIRKILTPLQCAKFVLFIQKNKYRKQLSVWDNKKQGNVQVKTENIQDEVHKKRKLN